MTKLAFRLAMAACLCAVTGLAQNNAGRPVSSQNSARLHDLMRAGSLYLSLQDALALAIENNLDIELQRYGIPAGDAELLRAQGGGGTRGLDFTMLEAPTGVGGPLSPVVTAAASSGLATAGSTVNSNALELGVLGEPQSNLSLVGTTGQSAGTAVPIYDPAIVGQLNWTHQTAQQLSVATEGINPLVTNTTLANAGIQQGFASGAQASLNFNNSRQSLNALSSQYNPYTGSSLGLNVTQPLLRGFGPSLNRRYIRIAGNERRVASLLFRQQPSATVNAGGEAVLRREGPGGRGHAGAGGADARQRAGLLREAGPDQCDWPAGRGRSHPQERADADRQRGPATARRAGDRHGPAGDSGDGRGAADSGPASGRPGEPAGPGPGTAADREPADRAGGIEERYAAGTGPGGRDAEQRPRRRGELLYNRSRDGGIPIGRAAGRGRGEMCGG